MYIYRLVFLLVLAIFIFSPTLMDWWIAPGSGWYQPFVVWLVLIGLGIWLQKRREPNEF